MYTSVAFATFIELERNTQLTTYGCVETRLLKPMYRSNSGVLLRYFWCSYKLYCKGRTPVDFSWIYIYSRLVFTNVWYYFHRNVHLYIIFFFVQEAVKYNLYLSSQNIREPASAGYPNKDSADDCFLSDLANNTFSVHELFEPSVGLLS